MDAFQQEMVSLLPRLRRFARTLAHDATDADDLTQVTVERSLERRAQWRTGTRLDSWMFRIMKNAWIDEARSRSRRGRILTDAEAGENVAGADADAVESGLVAAEIQRAMDELPAEQRLAVALVLVEGFSYRDAAEVLQIPEGTLTSRLVRGRSALMARLDRPSA